VTEAALMVIMAPRQGANGTFVFMLNIVMVIAIFYFLLIRPQRKEQQRHEKMIEWNRGTGDSGGGAPTHFEDRRRHQDHD
jgi:hypothetical protein